MLTLIAACLELVPSPPGSRKAAATASANVGAAARRALRVSTSRWRRWRPRRRRRVRPRRPPRQPWGSSELAPMLLLLLLLLLQPRTPAAPSCPRLVEAMLVEKQEAKDVAVLAAAARAAAVPATPPPRSLMVTAYSPLSGKREPGPPSHGPLQGRWAGDLLLSRRTPRGRGSRSLGENFRIVLLPRMTCSTMTSGPLRIATDRGDPALQPLGEAAWGVFGIMISRLLRLLRLAAGNDDVGGWGVLGGCFPCVGPV